jgi:hypothetical protein
VLGAAGGDQRLAQHYHPYGRSTVASGTPTGNIYVPQEGASTPEYIDSTKTAGSGASANVPPALVVNFIIYAGNAG